MGGGQQTSTTVQNNEPWKEAQPFLKQIMSGAQSAYNTGAGSNLWKGPTLAPQAPETLQAMDYTRNTAQAAQPYAQLPAAAASSIIANGGLSSGMSPGLGILGNMGAGNTNVGSFLSDTGGGNPYLQSTIDAMGARAGNAANLAMSRAGRYGSAGHQDALVRSVTDATAPYAMQAFEGDMNRRLQASQAADQTQLSANNSQLGFLGQGLDRVGNFAGMMPELNNLMYDPAARLAGVGGLTEARGQAELDAQRQLFEREQNLPWEQLSKYMGAVTGLSPVIGNAGTSTSTTTKDDPGMSPLGFLGGLLSLGSLFRSDARVKKDIVRFPDVIDVRTGAPAAFWRYKSDPDDAPLRSGPIAQDVMKTRPDLVIEIDGVLHIKG